MIAIIDYGMGNLRSVQKALEHLGADAVITRNKEDILSASHVVLPGVGVVSFGTAGCNLACQFCQNWHLSTARTMDGLQEYAGPASIATMARRAGTRGVAYTYNDPIIFAEYAIDVAAACRQAGLINIAVSAGSIEAGPRAEFFAAMEATNIDLKSFNPDFYRRVVGGQLETVLDTLRYVAHETDCWLEITTLLIPGLNDSDGEVRALTGWLADELGPSVPLHLTGFHPAARMRDAERTSLSTLRRARAIARESGLEHVYLGNVADRESAATHCPGCGLAVVERAGFHVTANRLGADGACPACGRVIPGIWG